jgi:hypothetical protein
MTGGAQTPDGSNTIDNDATDSHESGGEGETS